MTAENCKMAMDAMGQVQEDADRKISVETARVETLNAAVSEAMVKIRAMREAHAKEMTEKEDNLVRRLMTQRGLINKLKTIVEVRENLRTLFMHNQRDGSGHRLCLVAQRPPQRPLLCSRR